MKPTVRLCLPLVGAVAVILALPLLGGCRPPDYGKPKYAPTAPGAPPPNTPGKKGGLQPPGV